MLQWVRAAPSNCSADPARLLMLYLDCTVVPVSVSRCPTTLTTDRNPGQSLPVLRYSRQPGSLIAQHSRRSMRPCPFLSVVA